MENHPYFETDKSRLLKEIEEKIILFPEDKTLNTLLTQIKSSSPENLNGGLSYFVVESLSKLYDIGEKTILFEKKYRKL